MQVVQGLIVGVLSRRFSEAMLLRSSICVIAVAYALLVRTYLYFSTEWEGQAKMCLVRGMA